MSEVSDRIESLIEVDDWKGARKAIRAALRTEPESHWLLSRLALTYYEEFKYGKALEIEMQALTLAPGCPLTLWGYAGTLEMLGREREAIEVYRRLVRRGAESIAYGECGEGLAWARGLVAAACSGWPGAINRLVSLGSRANFWRSILPNAVKVVIPSTRCGRYGKS